jgi:hypothetical protein
MMTEADARAHVMRCLGNNKPQISHTLAYRYCMDSDDGVRGLSSFLQVTLNMDFGAGVFRDFLKCVSGDLKKVVLTLLRGALLPDDAQALPRAYMRVMLVAGLLRYTDDFTYHKLDQLLELVDSQLFQILTSGHKYPFEGEQRTEASALIQKEIRAYVERFGRRIDGWLVSLMSRMAVGLTSAKVQTGRALECLPAAIMDSLSYAHYLSLPMEERLLMQVPLVGLRFVMGELPGETWHYTQEAAKASLRGRGVPHFQGAIMQIRRPRVVI